MTFLVCRFDGLKVFMNQDEIFREISKEIHHHDPVLRIFIAGIILDESHYSSKKIFHKWNMDENGNDHGRDDAE